MAKDGTNRGGARPGAGRKKKTPEGTYGHVTFTAEQLERVRTIDNKEKNWYNEGMQITQEQYGRIAKYLPAQRGNVSMSNLQLINAILYVMENGCKWRALPKAYGNWHTIYVRMNRRSKNGVLGRVFAALQTEGIIQINVEAVCLDSTSVRVHPDGTGALKKRKAGDWKIARRTPHENSYGYRN